MALAIVPMAVMLVPVCLLLGQLALWYQSRPLKIGEEAVVALALGGDADSPWPDVRLEPTQAARVMVGPVRVLSKRQVCWNVEARRERRHHLRFQVGDETYGKELAVGDGFTRVSTQRPGWSWPNVLLHPGEVPFAPASAVRSIDVDHPDRVSWTSGTDSWALYWLVVSLLAALCLRRSLNVNI